jgi:hypothetical protein
MDRTAFGFKYIPPVAVDDGNVFTDDYPESYIL